ncbi:MAG: SDR family NAD(P)-dependent oxidoreductase, partial [Janthinobacterium lividum]
MTTSSKQHRSAAAQPRVVLVTGASSGIGRACAEHLHARGFRVYGTSRRAALEDSGNGFAILRMDVDQDASV